ncbi:MAG TPA: adenylate/guanylate cyclase domain-containing protein, partial [Actinomycetota bacterium]|nr:adenylate/guanylate cyclase domain-containing protein [Actinomycetota bacterium]
MTGSHLPTGTVTLLLADIEGSTRLWESDHDSMARGIAVHDRVVADALQRHNGVRPRDQGEGDAFVAAFERPTDAVACALEIQLGLAQPHDGTPIRLRIGVHTGEVHKRDEWNYMGTSINRTARVRNIGHGGQVLLSQVTRDLVLDSL